MTDSRRRKSIKFNVKSIRDKITQFWFVSVILMAFTFLSSIEQIEIFSKYLSQFLKEWRNILHGIIELPVNIFLKAIGRSIINLPSPWPEFIALFGLFVFTSFRKETLEQIKSVEKLVHMHWNFRIYVTKKMFEKITLKNLFICFCGTIIYIFLLLWALILISYVMLSMTFTDIVLENAITSVISVPILVALIFKNKSEKFDETIELQGYFVAPMVILVSGFIFLLSVSLELIVPNTISFIERANSL